MKLIIVESPNKKATIRGFLDSSYIVEASVGHIRSLSDKGWYDTGIDPDDNFKMRFAEDPGKREVISRLRELSKKAQVVYLASDEDREGEAIAWHLKEVLKLKEGQYKRITFNEITKKEVLKGLENPRGIDNPMVDSALTRSSIDKLLGYRISPVLWERTKGRSAGRVQSVALKILCDKEREIKAFVPHPYYVIELHFQKDGVEVVAHLKRIDGQKVGEILDKATAERIVESCKAGSFSISALEEKRRNVSANPPFLTSTFQQECSAKLGLQPKEAMRCAQRLFEGLELPEGHTGLITYIRTDSSRMDDDFKQGVYSLVVSSYGENYKGEVKESKSKSKEQGAHECIRVVDLSNTPERINPHLPDDNCRKVYKLIYDRTVASAMSDCVMSDEKAVISDGRHEFEAVGHTEVFDGWKKAYRYDDKDEKESRALPRLEKGEAIEDAEIRSVEKMTEPPKRYTEAKLIATLEDHGIGRPSTYASIMSILTDPKRNYTTKKNKSLVPTDNGLEVSKFLDEHFAALINLEYTSRMESDLDKVAEGEKKREQVVSEFFNAMNQAIDRLPEHKKEYEKVGRDCPECGKPLLYKHSRKGERFISCSSYPDCRHSESIDDKPKPHKVETEKTPTEKKCPDCGSPIRRIAKKDGTFFYGCSSFPKCKKAWSEESFKKLR